MRTGPVACSLQLVDVSTVSLLTSLNCLVSVFARHDVNHRDQLPDVSPLSVLVALSGCEQLNYVSPLSTLTSLTSLDLSLCDQLSDVSSFFVVSHFLDQLGPDRLQCAAC